MIRRTFLSLSAASVLSIPAMAAPELKIGFVYAGPISDHGWTHSHDLGRLAVEEAFGDRVATTHVENVSAGSDAERVLRRLAASGHGLIFATSFGFAAPTLKVADMFPGVKFELASDYGRAPNVSTYSSRFYEGRHVTGKIAGKMTGAGKIGYVAAFPIPGVVRGINAAALAARSVNRDVEVQVVWIGTWHDPDKEADAARTLIARGADVIMHHTDSPAILEVAQSEGVMAFGQATDMHEFAPDAQLTAIENDWAPYYVARTQAVLDGAWKSSNHWGGLKGRDIAMSPYRNMPPEVAALARRAEADVRAGRVHAFAGPIIDRNGVERIPAGEAMSDQALLTMDWFVQGVSGELPK